MTQSWLDDQLTVALSAGWFLASSTVGRTGPRGVRGAQHDVSREYYGSGITRPLIRPLLSNGYRLASNGRSEHSNTTLASVPEADNRNHCICTWIDYRCSNIVPVAWVKA